MFLSRKRQEKLDRFGAGLSLVCALHCAMHPLLLLALPLIGLGFLLNEQLESLILIFSVIFALGVLGSSLREHGQKQVLWPWLAGTALITLSRVFHEGEVLLAVAGALSLAGAHLLNTWYSRRAIQTVPETRAQNASAPSGVCC
ncbi:MAG: MerC domain-containing protein [Candidatus Sericytochromatia bacterium]|nr:MerC domain-containing protein [Candidatus Sericytochromatia bacterium]